MPDVKDVRVKYASLDGENEQPSPPITSTSCFGFLSSQTR